MLAPSVFIGFEDICNLAEEVKNPKRTLPVAILTAVGVMEVVYLVVSPCACGNMNRRRDNFGSRRPLPLSLFFPALGCSASSLPSQFYGQAHLLL